MQIRTMLIVALALVFGLSAAFGVNLYMRQQAKVEEKKIETVDVVVASSDIKRFDSISTDTVRVRAVPKDLVPKGALTKVEDAVGRVAYYPMMGNEILLEKKLGGKGRGMAPGIPEGKRGYSIQAHSTAAVAGLLLPGDKVDVILTISRATREMKAFTKTLLNNVEVLAVDQMVDAPDNNKASKDLRSVTLLVTQDQAEMLDLGQSKGTLSLTLRNPNDKNLAANSIHDARDLLNWVNPQPVAPKEDKVAEKKKEEEPHVVLRPQAAVLPPAIVRTLRGMTQGQLYLTPPPVEIAPTPNPRN